MTQLHLRYGGSQCASFRLSRTPQHPSQLSRGGTLPQTYLTLRRQHLGHLASRTSGGYAVFPNVVLYAPSHHLQTRLQGKQGELAGGSAFPWKIYTRFHVHVKHRIVLSEQCASVNSRCVRTPKFDV